MNVQELWHSFDQVAWDYAEGPLYDSRVKPANVKLERDLELASDLRDLIAAMETEAFLDWLRDTYFPWKFTGPEIVQQRRSLARHWADGSTGMAELERARATLIARNGRTKKQMIDAMCKIHGLSVAGASGLLALTYPETFGCVDVMVVKSFRTLGMFLDIPFSVVRSKDKKGNVRPSEKARITAEAAERMMDVMAAKAKELNRDFGNINKWKPRSIDRVLWAVRGGDFQPRGS